MQNLNNPQDQNNQTNSDIKDTPAYPGSNPSVTIPSSPITTPPIAEKEPISDEQAQNIKKTAVWILVGTALILAIILSVIFISKNTTQDKIKKDEAITKLVFAARTEATSFFNQNASYRDWVISEKTQNEALAINSYITLRKANFQNYMIFAKLSTGKYFCVDSNKAVEEIEMPKENQFLCKIK